MSIFCAYHQKSSFLPLPYIWPCYPNCFLLSPFPFGNHHSVVWIYEFIFVLLVLWFLFCFIFYIWVTSRFLFFSIWLIPHSIIPSRSIYIATNGKISSLWWLSSSPLFINTTSSLPIHQLTYQVKCIRDRIATKTT